jgi:hypothetical protein
MLAVAIRSAGGIVVFQHYLRWCGTDARHPGVLAACAPRIGSEQHQRWGARIRKPLDQAAGGLSRS